MEYQFTPQPFKEESSMSEETPAAVAINLADHIAYQDGSVVSKTLLQKQTGTVTLFAFDDGQKLSEHTAPFDAMVQVVDGEAELVIGGKPLVVGTGRMAIMPANISHAVNAVKRFKMLLTMIRS
jgi:quercetin dioxygenase-like cupin family protein